MSYQMELSCICGLPVTGSMTGTMVNLPDPSSEATFFITGDRRSLISYSIG